MTFTFSLLHEIIESLPNYHRDNFDYYRFSKNLDISRTVPLWRRIAREVRREFCIACSPRGGRYPTPLLNTAQHCLSKLEPYFSRFEFLYNILDNEPSKSLLVKLLAYRLLGHIKVKLPVNTPEYWRKIQQFEKAADYSDTIQVDFMNWCLPRIKLEVHGKTVEIHLTPLAAVIDYYLEQYRYRGNGVEIGVSPGDVVLDYGACWGDTALYFSSLVEDGSVWSFEFIPGNLDILQRNLLLNPELSKKISVVEHPVWNKSDVRVYFRDNGPGSLVSFEKQEECDGQANTLSVDDFIARKKIDRVDFIKMDIEGAELFALQGAKKTLAQHRPKLAIALYHSLDDFVEIPAHLSSLNLGYHFYLGHYTIHSEETVLFAQSEN